MKRKFNYVKHIPGKISEQPQVKKKEHVKQFIKSVRKFKKNNPDIQIYFN